MRAGFVGRAGYPTFGGLCIDGALRAWARDLSAGCFGFGPADVRDRSTEFGIRSQDLVIPVAVDAWGRHETSEPLEQLNRREQELGAAVGRRLG